MRRCLLLEVSNKKILRQFSSSEQIVLEIISIISSEPTLSCYFDKHYQIETGSLQQKISNIPFTFFRSSLCCIVLVGGS